MKNHHLQIYLVALLFCAAIVLLATSGAAQEETEPAGSRYSNPEGVVSRTRTPDIEPVYRGPSIDTLATIRKRGLVRIGVVIDEPVVMHDADGNLQGASVDLGRHLAEDLGVGVEFVQTSWAQLIPDLLNRQFDLIASGLWVTTDRALVVNFTDPTATEGIYLVASKTLASGMTTHEDFNQPDVRIVVYEGTIQEHVAERHFPKATLVPVGDDESDDYPVLEGEAHAVLVPTFAPRALVEAAPDRVFLPFDEPLETTITAMAVRKGDYDFVNFLNSWLRVQKDDGWLEDRIHYWENPANWME